MCSDDTTDVGIRLNLERRVAELERHVLPEPTPDTVWKWTEEVDRAVSRAQNRCKRGEHYEFKIPVSARSEAA